MRPGIRLEFTRVSFDGSVLLASFREKDRAVNAGDYEEYMVQEHIIRNRLLGQSDQFTPTALWLFDDAEISEHDLIHALKACRDRSGQKLLAHHKDFLLQ